VRLSVIIPTLNEQQAIEGLCDFGEFAARDIEVIVSDGGSEDATVAKAQARGFKIVTGPAGRGQQLRAGASVASGDTLLFLHADTRLQPGSISAIDSALTSPEIVGGNFRLLFDGGSEFAHWLNGFYAKLRANGFYYGDSAVFVRRRVYDRLGGIKNIELMEDFDFNRRLENFGKTICIDAPPAVTSSRRFEGRKRWRIVTQWIVIHLLFFARVSPAILAWLYRSRRHSPMMSNSEQSISVRSPENGLETARPSGS